MKRSSWASGSAYVPSCSIGFCVASTMNGSSSGNVRAADADLALLHRLQQRRLHLRRRAVDLVGEDDVGEDGALADVKLAVLRAVDRRAGDVGGQQVRRELDAHEGGVDRLRERADGERLREAGHAFDEDVAAAEHGDEQALDEHVLPDDHLRDFRADGVDEAALRADALVDGGDIDGQMRASVRFAQCSAGEARWKQDAGGERTRGAAVTCSRASMRGFGQRVLNRIGPIGRCEGWVRGTTMKYDTSALDGWLLRHRGIVTLVLLAGLLANLLVVGRLDPPDRWTARRSAAGGELPGRRAGLCRAAADPAAGRRACRASMRRRRLSFGALVLVAAGSARRACMNRRRLASNVLR